MTATPAGLKKTAGAEMEAAGECVQTLVHLKGDVRTVLELAVHPVGAKAEEISALRDLLYQIEDLESGGRGRVLNYLFSFFGVEAP